MGIWLAIDDFGTGSSSLAYLKQLPVTTLKVDRSFVTAMEEHDEDAAVVTSTIALGRNLGLRIVAEGVETEAAMNELRRLGCDLVQGYHVSRPVPAAEFEQWLRDRQLTEAAA
jgi:EAL domain-containing protein (putative c-di-GMP-specific phosphodiesterase class I)